MLKHLLTRRATILNEVDSTTDQYNNDVRTFTDTSGKLWKCRIDPVKSLEYEVDRDTRKSMFHFIVEENALAGGPLNGLSRVTVDGVTYEVFGEPRPFYRRSRLNHIEATLRIITG